MDVANEAGSDLLTETPGAEAFGRQYGVSPHIHREDFIFQYHKTSTWADDPAKVVEYYFSDGHNSARRLDELIAKFHRGEARPRSLFEFASGYGCVSRHLKALGSRYDVLACDIHPAAVEFLATDVGVPSLLSSSTPEGLDVGGKKFDVVFALSFFSHMPHATWGRWVRRLFDTVADDGLLIFTAHGTTGFKAIRNPDPTQNGYHMEHEEYRLERDGYWFLPLSEQLDLSLTEYGTMIVTPFYVMDQLRGDPRAKPIFYQESFWWDTQDVYVIRKDAALAMAAPVEDQPSPLEARVVRLEADLEAIRARAAALEPVVDHAAALQAEVAMLRASTSWRLTAPLRMAARLLK